MLAATLRQDPTSACQCCSPKTNWKPVALDNLSEVFRLIATSTEASAIENDPSLVAAQINFHVKSPLPFVEKYFCAAGISPRRRVSTCIPSPPVAAFIGPLRWLPYSIAQGGSSTIGKAYRRPGVKRLYSSILVNDTDDLLRQTHERYS